MDPRTEILIRPARAGDCPRMLELIHELAAYERAPEQVTVSPEHFRESGFGPAPVWWALVAEAGLPGNRTVAGFALYYIRYSTWKGQRMYLEDLLVTETWRGKGIGGKLMEALIREARRKGLSGISWQVLDWNEPAIRFYKKFGADFDPAWINVSVTCN